MKEKMMSSVIRIPRAVRSYLPDIYWELPDCHVGVELEYENALHLQRFVDRADPTHWKSVGDDSLRNNGMEFVFSEPYSGKDLSTALAEMEHYLTTLKEIGASKYPSTHYRTSTHVHVDVRDCTVQQYMNMIMLGILFEPALFHVAGEDRARNNFSLSSRYATGYFEQLSRAYNANSVDDMSRALAEQFKYSAINVTPPFTDEKAHPKKGSVEFRHHEGTTNIAKLRVWINILMCLKKAATRDDLFSLEWMHQLSSGKLLILMKEIFGKYTNLLVYDTLEEDCVDGARLVQDVIHLYKMQMNKQLTAIDLKLLEQNLV